MNSDFFNQCIKDLPKYNLRPYDQAFHEELFLMDDESFNDLYYNLSPGYLEIIRNFNFENLIVDKRIKVLLFFLGPTSLVYDIYIDYIVWWCRKHKRIILDMDDFSLILFGNGFPKTEELLDLYEKFSRIPYIEFSLN